MRLRPVHTLSSVALLLLVSHSALGGQEAPSSAPGRALNQSARVRSLINTYCIGCHDSRRKVAGLSLDALDPGAVGTNRDVWERVVKKLRVRAMPPVEARRPAPSDYDMVISHLEGALDGLATATPDPGRGAVARLNRAEYANAVRDVLALDLDVKSLLPADDSGYGFDNIADVLSTSPALLERYLLAAEKVSRLAVGTTAVRPSVEAYSIHNDFRQDARMGEAFAFGTRGGIAVRHPFPADGEYVLRLRLQRQANKDVGPIRGIAQRHELEIRLEGVRIGVFTIGGPDSTKKAADNTEDEKADDALVLRFTARRGLRELTAAFVDAPTLSESLTPTLPVRNYAYTYTTQTQMGVDRIFIDGPHAVSGYTETPSRQRLFTCRPKAAADAEPCARDILRRIARRAYRRPVTAADLAPLLEFYRTGSAKGGFDAGIELGLIRILVSPSFLFRTEQPPTGVAAGSSYTISDVALASRLSFFLWSSVPDDELLALAEKKRLRAPGVLQAQVRRMLADPRADALLNNFVGQWLYLRNIKLVVPDSRRFPDFDQNLRDALERETTLFVQSQLQEDHSIPELLTANYTFLNERLARHYGIGGIYGSHFRRVTYPDGKRAGLLGHGSLLTATSYADRTSPVTRGKWVLENILGTPPPPPPADVPSLKDEGGAERPRSMRERMEQHRRNPVCASCHKLMDPIGFGLENFDATGQWRTAESGTPIDPSGMLFDGSKFTGPQALRTLLARDPRQFTVIATEKLLTYALGRGLEASDGPAVRAIVRSAGAHDYHWSSIVASIVESVPFQMRRSK